MWLCVCARPMFPRPFSRAQSHQLLPCQGPRCSKEKEQENFSDPSESRSVGTESHFWARKPRAPRKLQQLCQQMHPGQRAAQGPSSPRQSHQRGLEPKNWVTTQSNGLLNRCRNQRQTQVAYGKVPAIDANRTPCSPSNTDLSASATADTKFPVHFINHVSTEHFPKHQVPDTGPQIN